MKLVEINVVCGVGSTGRIALNIAKTAQSAGMDACVVYGRGECAEPHTHSIFSSLGWRLHAMAAKFLDFEGRASRRATGRLVRFLKKEDPDVIHLHVLHGHFLHYPTLFSYLKTCGKTVLWTMHDAWAITGHCAYFSAAKCEKWKSGCHACPEKKAYPTSLWRDGSRGNYALKKKCFTGVPDLHVITPSRWLAELMRESFLGEYPIRVIPNGIDLSVFRPTESDFREKHGLSGKRIYLGVATEFGKRKGFGDFLKLAEKLSPEEALVLVGVSEEEKNQLPPSVLGIRRTDSQRELAEIYTAADMFINFTYEDNFPTVNLESLACGTPVLTYETGGSPESLTAACGIVSPQGDVDAALAAARRMVKTEEVRAACLAQAQKYESSAAFRAYISLIRELRGGAQEEENAATSGS